MGKLLLVLFTVVPLLELVLLVFLGNVMGIWPTVGLVLATGMLGAWLGKREGLRVFYAWRAALNEGRMPEEGLTAGLLALAGGLLLLTPGVLTDVAGLLLLLPTTRRWIAPRLQAAVQKRIERGTIRVTTARGGVGFGPAGFAGFGSAGFGSTGVGSTAVGSTGVGSTGARVIDVEGEVVEVSASAARGERLGRG